LEISKEAGSVLDDLRGPQESLQLRLDAINMLMQAGTISAQEYAVAMREAAASSDALSNSFSGGIAHGIATVAAGVDDLGKGVSELVVGAFSSATDAIVDFAKKGDMSFESLKEAVRSFFQDLFAQILQLALNQFFAKMLTGLAGGAGNPLGSVIGGLAGFSEGGSILPSGPGSTDSQVVAFKKRPDERVDILTPNQQKSQADQMNQSSPFMGSPTNVNVAVVMSEADILSAFSGKEGETIIIRGIQKNAKTIRKVVG